VIEDRHGFPIERVLIRRWENKMNRRLIAQQVGNSRSSSMWQRLLRRRLL